MTSKRSLQFRPGVVLNVHRYTDCQKISKTSGVIFEHFRRKLIFASCVYMTHEAIQNPQYARQKNTQLTKMSFDEILDLAADFFLTFITFTK